MLISIFSSKWMYKFGVPTLIIFLVLGMLVGSDGIGLIDLSDNEVTLNVASFALMVIIFSGGFATRWTAAQSSAKISISLSTVGVIITALVVGLFIHLALGQSLLISFLIGSIISSTDAASVFSILKSHKLNLKNNLASTLEIESGSNDPFAFLLTILFLGLIQGDSSFTGWSFVWIVTTQIVFGIGVGVIVGYLGVFINNRIRLEIDGLYMILAFAVMLLSFGLSSYINGNGFLAVYLTGIIMGNLRMVHKVSMVRFFDGFSWLMQIVLFFTLGLFVYPSQLAQSVLPGLLIAIILVLIARPIAVFTIMSIFKKPIKEQIFVSWVGFRGAASIVFAIYPLALGMPTANLIFNVVFFVAIFTTILQGTTLVPLAKRLNLIEATGTVLKTFTDYSGDTYTSLLEVKVHPDSPFVNHAIKDIDIPDTVLVAMIKRDGKIITPRGLTVILANDLLLVAGDSKEELLELEKNQ